jgi:hypothetical protein
LLHYVYLSAIAYCIYVSSWAPAMWGWWLWCSCRSAVGGRSGRSKGRCSGTDC